MQTLSLRKLLDSWPYHPDNNVRLAKGADGRDIVLVRQPLGLEQYEINGRPDGQRPHGMESILEFYLGRSASKERVDGGDAFKLTAEDCAKLFDEGLHYYHRCLSFLRLKDWPRAERDAERNLRLMSFVRRYAEHEEDRIHLEEWRLDITLMNGIAQAMVLLGRGRQDDAIEVAREAMEKLSIVDRHTMCGGDFLEALFKKLPALLAVRPILQPREESVFSQNGDYWTIMYLGQVVRLRATRGLQCLAILLRHPSREFHAGELLLGEVLKESGLSGKKAARFWNRSRRRNANPSLDAQAKVQYKDRLRELRRDLDEAQKANDASRAAMAEQEISLIAEHVAAAVGLGGRGRKAASQAERARSAVTHRIKDALNRIETVMPMLARHLLARIKTGHFCSYNPHPERPVAWKF